MHTPVGKVSAWMSGPASALASANGRLFLLLMLLVALQVEWKKGSEKALQQ